MTKSLTIETHHEGQPWQNHGSYPDMKTVESNIIDRGLYQINGIGPAETRVTEAEDGKRLYVHALRHVGYDSEGQIYSFQWNSVEAT